MKYEIEHRIFLVKKYYELKDFKKYIAYKKAMEISIFDLTKLKKHPV
jgi:hypothetical protein